MTTATVEASSICSHGGGLIAWGEINTLRDLSKFEDALDLLNERYARGEINREEFGRMKVEIARA